MRNLWTLPEALAWCIWRNEDAVKKSADVHIDCMGLLNAAIREAEEDQIRAKYAFSMRDSLHEALYSGNLKAVGVPQRTSVSREIPAAEWRDIEEFSIFFHGKKPDDIGVMNSNGDTEIIYTRVTVNRDDVQKLWPSIAGDKYPKKIAPTAEHRSFLEKAIADRGGFIGQLEAYRITREKFPNVSRKSIIVTLKSLIGIRKRGRPKTPK